MTESKERSKAAELRARKALAAKKKADEKAAADAAAAAEVVNGLTAAEVEFNRNANAPSAQ